MPPGVAGVQQRRPAALLVDRHRGSRIGGEHVPHRLGVANHGRGEQAAPGDARIGTDDVTSLPKAPVNHRADECSHTSIDVGGPRVDSGLEPRPARKPSLPGDDQLGRSQAGYTLGRRWVVAAEALRRRRVTAADRIEQLPCLAAQLPEIGALGNGIGRGHAKS